MPSLLKVQPQDVESFTVIANPIKTYSSSSTGGPVGSVYLFARRSPIQKDVAPDSSFVESQHDDADLSSLLRGAKLYAQSLQNGTATQGPAEFTALMQQYMSGCTSQEQALRLQEVIDVQRFSPPPVFNSDSLRKLVIKDQLNTFYRTSYPQAQWAYSNYNTLNFFTASTVSIGSAILYPNIDGGDGGLVYHEGYCSGTYTPSGSFSFDFYINPRYQPDEPNGVFKAGTILHLSSTYALSLISGSMKDVNGRTSGFRLQLQLSHSADIAPSLASPGVFPHDLVFLSDDNSLLHNNWHHCVVRWGTDQINHGVGTFNIDLVDKGAFTVPSSTIVPRSYSASSLQDPPAVLCMGNFYDGPNNSSHAQAMFFAADPALRDGLNQLWPDTGIESPNNSVHPYVDVYKFEHPLNAELHDVAIRRCYMSDLDISTSASLGPASLDNTFALYVPPFFVNDSPYRQYVNDHGGILITPFEESDGNTTQPFSVALSFGVAGHYINLENFVKDFASEQFPMLHHLTGVALQSTTNSETCNEFLYSQPFVARRNLTILPNDDGNFVPSYQLLASESLSTAVNDLGNDDLSYINLDNMVKSNTLMFGPGTFDDGTQPDAHVNAFANTQIGSTPEFPFASAGKAIRNYINTVVSGSDVEAGAPLTVYQRTQDPSSNEIVIFDISNMFYGMNISPTTLSIKDSDLLRSSMYGSSLIGSGPISISLADDGHGNVYRADCLTPQATWNTVGNVYYNEGELLVKSPHLYFFGANQYVLNFRGEQHIQVMKIGVLAANNTLLSSSNPNYQALPPTGYPNDPDNTFVYITGINFHDTDMNVVMKTTLAQPMMKRPGDRIMFRVQYDW